MRNKVSVIVLSYNQVNTISRTLDSILAQIVDFSFEIIIGDDASYDGTRNICEQYAAKYPLCIKLMEKSTNKGVVKNYLDCLDKSNGKYIMGCAGDDWWHNRNKMQLQVSFLDSHSRFSLVFGGCILFNAQSGQTYQSYPRNGVYSFYDLLSSNPISALTICYRNTAKLKEELKVLETEHFLMEDYPLYLILAKSGDFYCMRDLLGTYTLSEGSISNSSSLSSKETFENDVLRVKLFFLKKYKIDDYKFQILVLDMYHLSLSTNGIRYNDKRYCLKHLLQIQRKRIVDYIKIVLCIVPFGFLILRSLNKKIIVKK